MGSRLVQFTLGLVLGGCALLLLDPEAEFDGPALLIVAAVVPVALAGSARLVRWSDSIAGEAVGGALGCSLVLAGAAATAGSFDSSPASIFLMVFAMSFVAGMVTAMVVGGLVAAGATLFGSDQNGAGG